MLSRSARFVPVPTTSEGLIRKKRGYKQPINPRKNQTVQEIRQLHAVRHRSLVFGPAPASVLLELLERRYDASFTVLCTHYAEKGWHQRLGSRVYADAITDRLLHNTTWMGVGDRTCANTQSASAPKTCPERQWLSGRASPAPRHVPTHGSLAQGLGLWKLNQRSPAFA